MTATCDIRFSLQGRYASNRLVRQLAKFGISNGAVTIPGRATLSDNRISAEDFICAKDALIRSKLTAFLSEHGMPRDDDLVVLDMEPRDISPRQLGNFDGSVLDALIKAYRRRIRVAREVLSESGQSGVQLAMYQVIVPDGRGRFGEGFMTRMAGYRLAGDKRMYDQLDSICPVLYHRFGPDDTDPETLRGWIGASTRQAIDQSLTLTRSDRTPIPLVPILSFWVFNPGSGNDRCAVSPETVALQLEIVQDATGIATILFWSGSETEGEMETAKEPVEPINIRQFLRAVGTLPWDGCA